MRICFSANLLQPELLRVRPLHTLPYRTSCTGRRAGDSVESTEPEFLNLVRIPGIDSEPGGPIRQPYGIYFCTGPPGFIGWRNRFLNSLNIYIYPGSAQSDLERNQKLEDQPWSASCTALVDEWIWGGGTFSVMEAAKGMSGTDLPGRSCSAKSYCHL
jgi:hypothetical protein